VNEILSLKNLEKSYASVKALNGITASFELGKIYGLLGPNGSGKTTLLKICAALSMQYKGEVLINGNKPGLYTKPIVAYLPDGNYFFDWMDVGDAVDFFDDFFDDFDRNKAENLLKELELEKSTIITTLSKGMHSRLKLAIVLSRKAKLYLLDEAFDGVDPITREKIIDLILSTFDNESTIILATHHIDYVEILLDEVKLLHKGEIIREISAEDIREKECKSVSEFYMEVFKNVQTSAVSA